MKENLRQTPSEDPRKSQRGEIKVGDAGGLGFLAGLFVLGDGVANHSEFQMYIGGAVVLAITFEAVATSLINSLRNNKSK